MDSGAGRKDHNAVWMASVAAIDGFNNYVEAGHVDSGSMHTKATPFEDLHDVPTQPGDIASDTMMNQFSGEFAGLNEDSRGLPEDLRFIPRTVDGSLSNKVAAGTLDLEIMGSLASTIDKNEVQGQLEPRLVFSARLRYIWNPFKEFIDVVLCLIFLWRLGLVQLPVSLSNSTFATRHDWKCAVYSPWIPRSDYLMYRRIVLATLHCLHHTIFCTIIL